MGVSDFCASAHSPSPIKPSTFAEATADKFPLDLDLLPLTELENRQGR